MQSMLNIYGSYGLPISVSGITHHFIISEEMADHDLKRESLKKQRLQAKRRGLHRLADEERNPEYGGVPQDMEAKIDWDLAVILHDLASCRSLCIAKAA